MTEKTSKLEKMGYKWVKVSKMFEDTPPVTAYGELSKRYKGYEGLWCKLIMGVTSYAMTNNSVAIVHGPTNCGWAIRNFCSTNYSLYYGNPFLHIPCTDIDESSVIHGGNDALMKTILEVDRDYKPESICVFDTCSTALTADDIDFVVKNAQKSCNAKINYFPSAGFTSIPLGKSIEELAEKYVDMMEFSGEVIPDTINIIGQYKEQHDKNSRKCSGKRDGSGCGNRGKYPDDAHELASMAESIGLKVHRVLISGDIEYIKTALQASINVISCPTWGLPMAKQMKEKFNTPYSSVCIPIGINTTSKWLRELAKSTNKEDAAEKFISQKTEELSNIYEKAKQLVSGKSALIECGRNSQTAFARPMALGRALEELGMKVYLFGIHPVELKAKEIDVEYFLNDGFNPEILSGNYDYQRPVDVNEVASSLGLKPDEYIYFTQDVFPMAKGGYFDVNTSPRVETGVHLRRIVNAPGRGVGFSGAKALYESIIESVNLSSVSPKPTLYGRVHGKFYEYEML